jgi:hypothetical protein
MPPHSSTDLGRTQPLDVQLRYPLSLSNAKLTGHRWDSFPTPIVECLGIERPSDVFSKINSSRVALRLLMCQVNSMLLQLIAAVIFSALGIAVLAFCFWLMEKLTPFSIIKEIEEDHNIALAIIVGAVMIGLSIIIAAAMHG